MVGSAKLIFNINLPLKGCLLNETAFFILSNCFNFLLCWPPNTQKKSGNENVEELKERYHSNKLWPVEYLRRSIILFPRIGRINKYSKTRPSHSWGRYVTWSFAKGAKSRYGINGDDYAILHLQQTQI